MSFTTAITRLSYNGDATSVNFTVPWLFYANTDLLVIVGGATQSLGVQFNISGAGIGSGTVSFVSPPPIGVGNIQIILNDPLTQTANFVDGTAFPSNTLNQVNDRAVQISSRLYDLITRSLRAPDGDAAPNMLLPPAAQRANTYQTYDTFGNSSTAVGLVAGTILSAASIGAFIGPAVAAEAGTAVISPWIPYGDVRRYGILPNLGGAQAMTNTAILKALASYGGVFSGRLFFTNITGIDNYQFTDIVVFNPGIAIDLCGSTLTFTKVGVAADTNAGFIHAIRNFKLENGSIVINYTYVTGGNTGNAIGLGGRDVPVGGSPLPTIFDSLLSAPMGNITLRNLNISSNAGGGQARGIFALGGLVNVVIENVTIDGQGVNLNGLYAEFGFATNEASSYLRQSSHPNNWQVKNFNCKNVTLEAYSMNGAYGITVDGIRAISCGGVVAFGMGEALFYRPWVGNDGAGSKRNIFVRNADGASITGVGYNFAGSTTLAAMNASYLGGPSHNNPNGLTNANLVDLLEFTLENFVATGTVNNYGVLSSAGRATIRGGTLTGFQRGVVTTQECTNWSIEQVEVFDCTGLGMVIGQAGNTVYSPARQSTGKVSTCFIAGSGTTAPAAAISISTTAAARIEHCRFGYELIHDLKTETTQLQAVNASTDAFGVVGDDNYVAATSGGAAAYSLAAATTSRGCTILNDSYGAVWLGGGGTKYQGIWENTLLGQLSPDWGDTNQTYSAHTEWSVMQFATTLTANRTVTLSTTNAVAGDRLRVVRTGLGAFTLAVGALKTIPSATAAVVEAEFDGAAWKLIGYMLL